MRKNGVASILAATAIGCEDLVLSLLNRDANINSTNQFKDTPLLAATVGGCVDLILLLLGRGADIEAANRYGITPLLAVTVGGCVKLIQIFLQLKIPLHEILFCCT